MKPLVASISDDWKRKKSDLQWKTMRINAELSRKISLYCFAVTAATVISFFIQQTYLNFRGFYGERQWFYQSSFPYETFKSPGYEFTCFFQVTGGTLTGLVYTGVVNFLGMLILHLHGQFSILQMTIETLINSHSCTYSNEFIPKLKFIVKQHEHLNRFELRISGVLQITKYIYKKRILHNFI